ncbi:MAG: DUF3098 domain-containing protein [Chitinophagaceae bacterium]
MKITKQAPAPKDKTQPFVPFFEKENIWWMLGGLAVMALGFVLMAGGKNTDPNVFDESKVYSFTRITIAPLLILAGLVIEIVALFRNSKTH